MPQQEVVAVDVPGPWQSAEHGGTAGGYGEIALVSRQVMGCWNPPGGDGQENAPDFVIRVQLDRQAVVTATELRTPDQATLDPPALALVQSAERALVSCGPLHLPSDKYESWRELDFRFSARDLAFMAVRKRIATCFEMPSGLPGPAEILVQLRVEIDPDGTVRKVDVRDKEKLQSSKFAPIADAATRAVMTCGPYSLPSAEAESPRVLIVPFQVVTTLPADPASTAGRRPTEAERALLKEARAQIMSCWEVPRAPNEIAGAVVELLVELDPDGYVQKVDVQDKEKLRNPSVKAIADAATRAVRKCSPYSLPPAEDETPRVLIVPFHVMGR